MKKTLLALSIVAFSFSFAACDVVEDVANKAIEEGLKALPGSVSGVVSDTDGNPISGAKVTSWNLLADAVEIVKNPGSVSSGDGDKMVIDLEKLAKNYKPDTTTTNSSGKYKIDSAGAYIIKIEAECYAAEFLGISDDRKIKTTIDKEKWVFAGQSDVVRDVTLTGGCDAPAPAPEPDAEDLPAPPANDTPPEEVVVEDKDGNVIANPTADQMWTFKVDDTDASAGNKDMDRPDDGLVDITGNTPSDFDGNSAVLIVDVVSTDGEIARSLNKVKLANGEFVTQMKIVEGLKTMLSMGYPPEGMGNNDPSNISYVVSIDDVGKGDVPDFTATLTWDKTGGIDMDIHAIAVERDGTEVYWANKEEEWGFLDIDNMEGLGPEVITINDANSGNVMLGIHAWNDPDGTICTVRVITPGSDSMFIDDADKDGNADNLKNSKDWWIIGAFDQNGIVPEE